MGGASGLSATNPATTHGGAETRWVGGAGPASTLGARLCGAELPVGAALPAPHGAGGSGRTLRCVRGLPACSLCHGLCAHPTPATPHDAPVLPSRHPSPLPQAMCPCSHPDLRACPTPIPIPSPPDSDFPISTPIQSPGYHCNPHVLPLPVPVFLSGLLTTLTSFQCLCPPLCPSLCHSPHPVPCPTIPFLLPQSLCVLPCPCI